MNQEISQALQELNKWRKTKKYKHSPIPEQFWVKLRALHNKYPDQKIKTIFNINNKSWNKKVLDKVVNYKKENSFVLASPLKKEVDHLQPLMKLKLNNGTEIMVFQ